VNEKILIVDDDPSVHEVACPYLEHEGYIVYSATEGRAALALVSSRRPALLVLDRMLPDISGETVLLELRGTCELPILMLSARAGTEDRVQGLSLGADDYLAKPFSPRELVARVKALLRRGKGTTMAEDLKTFDQGRLQIDGPRHEVRVGGRLCEVTPSEFNLLVALAGRPGRVYTREELAYRARGNDYEGYERTIDAHIKNLRRKIEDDPARPRFVETIRGVGYRLGVERS
jgi:DNA-binding response OmpR family regulator